MSERNSITLVLTTVILIVITEVIEFNYKIGINYLPILCAIFSIIIFHTKLTEMNRANPLVTDVVVVVINAIATYFILGTFSYSSCIALLIFAYFVESKDINQIDLRIYKKDDNILYYPTIRNAIIN